MLVGVWVGVIVLVGVWVGVIVLVGVGVGVTQISADIDPKPK